MAFRQTLVCLKRFQPSESAPTQILLRVVSKLGTPTSEEIWQEAKSLTDHFKSKNQMKKSLRFLCNADRLVSKPKDPLNHKINFIFKLGSKPQIVSSAPTSPTTSE